MKRIFLVSIMLIITSVAAACGNKEIIFEDIDLTDLETCFSSIKDDNEATTCNEETQKKYLDAYAEQFLQYLDVVVEDDNYINFSDSLLKVDLGFKDLPNENATDAIAIMNEIINTIEEDFKALIGDMNSNSLFVTVQFHSSKVVNGDPILSPFAYWANIQNVGIEVNITVNDDIDFSEGIEDELKMLDKLKATDFEQYSVSIFNETEFVEIKIYNFNDLYSVFVGAKGPSNETNLTADMFVDEISEMYPNFKNLDQPKQ